MNRLRMSLSLGSLILVGIAAPATSQAQIAVNMSLLTCGQYPCHAAGPVSHLCRLDEWVVQSEDGLHLYQP